MSAKSSRRRTPKSEGIFSKFKSFVNEGLEFSIVLHEGENRSGASLRLPTPPAASKQEAVLRNQSASSSHGGRSSSREADGSELQAAPSAEPDQKLSQMFQSAKYLDSVVLEVKSSVNQFAQALISDMATFSEDLEPLKQAIRRAVKAEVDRANHWKFLVQAFVGQRLFEGFDAENGFFGVESFDGLHSTPCHSFADFCKFKDKSATISNLLAQTPPDSSFLGKFCFQKFKSITGDLATNHPLLIYEEDWSTIENYGQHPNSDFYQCFLKAAVSIWLLHRLVHSSEQSWKILAWKTYPKDSKFQQEFMELVVPAAGKEGTDLNIVVGFLVLPGFQMSNSVVKCEVYPPCMLGRGNEIPLAGASNDQERGACSSHGDGNAVESSSHEYSHGSGTSVWSSSTVSGASSFAKSSRSAPTHKTSFTIQGRARGVSEPLPTLVSSSSSGSTRQDRPSKPSLMNKLRDSSIFEDVVKDYSWDQVLRMTNGPTSKQLGKGGFGTVFLGKLENGKEVAVKILDRSSQQGTPEFLNEVNLLSRANHLNLVRLLGYCQDEEQVLIYEFAEEGSIWDHLHGEKKWLDWRQRLSIALQSACGLEYLHTLCSPRIIHRDVKSENILVTKTMVAKVSDFGLSRVGTDQDNNHKTHITTKVMGTRGYLDPEYHLTGQLRDSSDVYSFGIVLLEIITGRKPVPNSDPKGCITNWVEKTYGSGGSKAVKALADPLFRDNYDPRALKLVIDVARSCIKSSGDSRPDISKVVRVLRKAQALELDEKKSWFSFCKSPTM